MTGSGCRSASRPTSAPPRAALRNPEKLDAAQWLLEHLQPHSQPLAALDAFICAE